MRNYVPFVLPLAVSMLRSRLPAWAFMAIFCVSIFFSFKSVTWLKESLLREAASVWRSLGYLFLWPGMDAKSFLNTNRQPTKPHGAEWAMSILKTSVGATMIWVVARFVPSGRPVIIGWVGVIGFLFLFHFGIFHIVSLIWRTLGVEAQPIMNAPFKAAGLSDFWSNRWNLGFRQLTHELLLRPLRQHRHFGIIALTLIPFLASGIIHDLAISFPAADGYGLPTLYFLAQGFGIVLERSILGRKIGIQSGIRGWLFTVLVVGGPAYWMFHPPFMVKIIVPLLNVIGAVPRLRG